MSIVDPMVNFTYTFRIYKRLVTNPALVWANMYEVQATTDLSQADLTTAAIALVQFEQEIHLTDVAFDRVVISTWLADGVPYNPSSFYSEGLTGLFGQRGSNGDPLSLNHVLFVRRVVGFGQSGKVYYRRVLGEGDVSSPSGTIYLLPVASVFADFLAAKTILAANNLLGLAASPLRLVMAASGVLQRPVNNLSIAGVRIVQFNNRYYDVP